MLTMTQIFNEIEKNRATLQKYGVRKLGLFGSFARGETHETSDLDFVVVFEKKTFDGYMDTKEFLETLFKRQVDLVISDAIKPRLRKAIQEEAVYVPGL